MSEAIVSLSSRTERMARMSLAGRVHGLRAIFPFFGPAVVASIAYMDPGNFATNIQAGARYGYMLLWVVLVANVVAMFFQSLSARIGIVTGQSLASLCRAHFPRPVVLAMWVASEIAAVATDVAETIGAAIGISLLLGVSLMTGLLTTFVVTWGLLMVQSRGFRPIELIITGFIGVIGLSYLIELVIAPPAWGAVAFHTVVPQLTDADSVLLAVGIVGATVMPHVIYLHSALMPGRVTANGEAEKRRLLRFSNIEVVVALGIAGLINMAMVIMAATMFHKGYSQVGEIETAYHTLIPLFGGVAAGAFMASLLASGISSSVVGTMAGQTIMQDFVHVRIPVSVRRLVTMLPAIVVVGIGVAPTEALVISQVVLSLVLPVPMISLLMLVGRPSLMGSFAIRPGTRAVAIAATAVVLGLNAILLLQTFGVSPDLFTGN
ncbi:Nramp family divalent metal transporter [Rhodopila sp.]|jgi:manganese transport protein|uniref:Nramp family divalent metal transporter n=1 Tax=Rhodopila sp. TaxID=2480087 RepID=UPI002C31582D|nr:Nramp family divalent metal transporter [Rhodopila sp.]HVZ06846.1 Nramp family divalent metal transporter [Rhodopila sp.]